MPETGHIRIGNQTAFSASSITAPFRYAIARGFDAFEWFPDTNGAGQGWTDQDLGEKTRARIRQLALDHDVSLSVHAPWQANPLERKSHDLLYRNIAFAQDLGASLFNIHLNIEKGIDTFIRAIIPFIRHLGGKKIRFSLENTPDCRPEDFNALFRGLDRLVCESTDHVGMCLDLGHANLCPETLNDYIRYMDLLDDRVPVIHVHVHENYGDHDTHLPLFTGPSRKDPSGIGGFLDRLRARGFSGAIIMEQWPQPPGLLDEARKRLGEMLMKKEDNSMSST